MNEWKYSNSYLKEDKVVYLGETYIANCRMISTLPPNISSNWEILKEETMNTTTTWQERVNYGAGDVVYYKH